MCSQSTFVTLYSDLTWLSSTRHPIESQAHLVEVTSHSHPQFLSVPLAYHHTHNHHRPTFKTSNTHTTTLRHHGLEAPPPDLPLLLQVGGAQDLEGRPLLALPQRQGQQECREGRVPHGVERDSVAQIQGPERLRVTSSIQVPHTLEGQPSSAFVRLDGFDGMKVGVRVRGLG